MDWRKAWERRFQRTTRYPLFSFVTNNAAVVISCTCLFVQMGSVYSLYVYMSIVCRSRSIIFIKVFALFWVLNISVLHSEVVITIVVQLFMGVLVCSGCCNALPSTEWCVKSRHVFLRSLEAQTDLLSGEGLLFLRSSMAEFCPHLAEGAEGTLQSLL